MSDQFGTCTQCKDYVGQLIAYGGNAICPKCKSKNQGRNHE